MGSLWAVSKREPESQKIILKKTSSLLAHVTTALVLDDNLS
jgi:hypothetical protein